MLHVENDHFQPLSFELLNEDNTELVAIDAISWKIRLVIG
jgi:hypothetical protein